ncbi:HD domain-containing protein [bacterium]|nr:HD domain-containing protein [bacterium]
MKRHLKDFDVGEVFTGFFILRKKDLRSRRDGVPYLTLEFCDCSGRLKGNIWEDAERFYHSLKEGGVVKLKGLIETYRGSKQVAIKQIRNSREKDSYELSDLMPTTEIDREATFQRIYKLIEGFRNPYLKQLLLVFFDDEAFKDDFISAPGGKLWHHNRIGGLIEHTMSVVRICRMLARFYPVVNPDLLLSGAILHDVGKIEEYRYDTMIEYSDRGRLVGHITLGASLIREMAYQIDDFPDDLLDKLTHLILSHQGEREFGSPIPPSTREAFLLHYADLIDSKMDALQRISKEIPEGQRWEYVNLLGRFIDFDETT